MSGTGGNAGTTGDQFYVTHCLAMDSVLKNPGYAVRAASSEKRDKLNAALQYPPYELPLEMWKDLPAVADTPCRLARTEYPKGGVWVVHSAYLTKDTVGRDRSYFSHLLLLPKADPGAVLQSWGAEEWIKSYPKGAEKELSPDVFLPVGTLVDDTNLTAFLSEHPPGPLDLSTTVCPRRLRGPASRRRELFARFLQAVVLLTEEEKTRLLVHAEPGVIALLLYGATRLLPKKTISKLTFTTYEPYHRNIRDYKLAQVVGTYLGAPGKPLEASIGNAFSFVLDTMNLDQSSPVFRKPLPDALPTGLNDLIDLVIQDDWVLVDEIHQTGRKAARSDESEVIEIDESHLLPLPASPLGASTSSGAMEYSAQISRTNPSCLLFLVDQSQSMAEPFIGNPGQTKATVVADALNRLIQNVVLRSAKADGVRDYFHVGVIGYGKGIQAGFGGSLPFNTLVPVSELGMHPLRVESRMKLIPDGAGGLVEREVKFPIWFDAVADGTTPMCEAFSAAGLAIKGFVEQYPNSYPPIVLNLTDGMPSDGNPQSHARSIRNMRTSDGAALVFNLLISNKPVQPDYFPATEDHFPDNCAKLLFRMSSILPPKLWEAAKTEGHHVQPRARGVVINADPTAIVRFLDIGTRVTSPSGR